MNYVNVSQLVGIIKTELHYWEFNKRGDKIMKREEKTKDTYTSNINEVGSYEGMKRNRVEWRCMFRLHGLDLSQNERKILRTSNTSSECPPVHTRS